MTSAKTHGRHDPALVVDIHELTRTAGAMRHVRAQIEAPEGLGIELIRVQPGTMVDLDLTLESVIEGVWVSGTARAQLLGECSRCLTPVTDEQLFDVQELYYYRGRDAEEDAHFVHNDQIDLDPLLRDAIVLELPFTPLCRSDCAGLCIECGENLNDDPDHGHDEVLDARWENLAGLGTDDQAAQEWPAS